MTHACDVAPGGRRSPIRCGLETVSSGSTIEILPNWPRPEGAGS